MELFNFFEVAIGAYIIGLHNKLVLDKKDLLTRAYDPHCNLRILFFTANGKILECFKERERERET